MPGGARGAPRAEPMTRPPLRRPLACAAAIAAQGLALAQPAPPPGALAPDAPPPEASPPAPPAEEAPRPKPAYSLPWGLRPPVAPTVVRLDTVVAIQDNATTMAPVATAGYRFLPDLGGYLSAAYSLHAPDGRAPTGALSNPLLFGLYTPEIAPALRLDLYFAFAPPFGQGGGNGPDPERAAAIGAGTYARSGLNNALFAVNEVSVITGAGAAYALGRLSFQGELTLLRGVRVRGADAQADKGRVNSGMALHAGYALTPFMTLSLETRYQRFLSTPAPVKADPARRDQLTAGGGVRFAVPVSETFRPRPGLAYFQPLDDPMRKAGYRIVEVDLLFPL